MTLIVEINAPWGNPPANPVLRRHWKRWFWKPGRFQSRVMTRYWWGCVAVSRLHISLQEYSSTEFDWIEGE